jgi:hypothetical protein
MEINNDLVSKIRKAKELLQNTTPIDKPGISLIDWMSYIKNTPRTADDKALQEYRDKLRQKGIID